MTAPVRVVGRLPGIPRRLLDRTARYVIAHVGQRWEVVGVLDDSGEIIPTGPAAVAARAGGPRTTGAGVRAEGSEGPGT